MGEGSTVIKEIRARFTADLSGYRKAMQQAIQPTKELHRRIEQMQEKLRKSSAAVSADGQKMNRTLTAASRATEQLGKQAQSLVTKERQLTRAIEEQQYKLDGLQAEYDAAQKKASGLQSVYDRVRTATAGIDISTPLKDQVEQVKRELGQFDVAIENLCSQLSNTAAGSLVELPDGSFASISEAKVKLRELSEQFDAADARLEQLQNAMRAVGAENLGYASTAGLKQLQAEITQSRQRLAQLELQAGQTASRMLTLNESYDQVTAAMERNGSETDKLRDSVQQLDQSNGRLGRLRSALSGVHEKLGKVAGAVKTVGSAAGQMGGKLGNAVMRLTGLSGIVQKIKGIGSGAKSATGGVEGLLHSIKRIGVVALGLNIAKGLFGRLRSVISSYVSTQEGLTASVDRLKNGLGQALAPAINIVINAMSRLMPYIVGVADAIGTLLTNLFGKGWTTVAAGASAAASATGSAAAAQEKYNRTLAGFDEITKLDDGSSSGGSGGGGGGSGSTTTPVQGKLPAWLTDLTEQIKELLSAEDFTGIGSLLADKFGELVDSARAKLNNGAFRGKVSRLCGHVVDTINGFFGEFSFSDEARDSIATRTGALFGDGLTLALDTIDQFLTGIRWDNIGLSVAQGINGAIGRLSADQVNFGKILADLIQSRIDATKGFIDGLHWSDLGRYVADNINSAFSGIDWKKVTATLSGGVRGVLDTISSALANIRWSDLARDVEQFISGIDWGGVTAALFRGIGTAFGGITAFVGTLIADAFSDIYDYFANEVEEAGGNVVMGILNGINDAIMGIDDWIKEHIFRPFIDGFKSVFGIHSPAKNPQIVSLGRNLVAGMFNGITEWMGGITGWVRQHIMQPVQNAVSRLGTVKLEIENRLKNTATTLWSKFQTAWGSAQSRVVEVWNQLKNSASNLWNGFKNSWGGSKVVEIVNNLRNSASTLWNNLRSQWGNASRGGLSVSNTLSTSGDSLFSTLKSRWGNSRYLGVQASVQSKISPKNLFTNEQVSFAFKNGSKKVGNLVMTRMARGGIINSATLFPGGVLAGEAGKEAIVPLDRNTGWADNVAKRMNELSEQQKDKNPKPANPAPIIVHNYVQLDGRTVWKNTVQYAQADAKRGEYPLSGCV